MKNLLLIIFVIITLISCSEHSEKDPIIRINEESLINLNSIYLYEGKPFNGISFVNTINEWIVEPKMSQYIYEKGEYVIPRWGLF